MTRSVRCTSIFGGCPLRMSGSVGCIESAYGGGASLLLAGPHPSGGGFSRFCEAQVYHFGLPAGKILVFIPSAGYPLFDDASAGQVRQAFSITEIAVSRAVSGSPVSGGAYLRGACSLRLFRRADVSEQPQPCGHCACAAFYMQPLPAGGDRPARERYLPY